MAPSLRGDSVLRDELSLYGRWLRHYVGTLCFVMNCRCMEGGSIVTWDSVLRDELSLYGRWLRRYVGTLCFVMNCRCMEDGSVVTWGLCAS